MKLVAGNAAPSLARINKNYVKKIEIRLFIANAARGICMEIHVKDNAINSLEVGLAFYNKFLNRLESVDASIEHFGNLKFTVIALHNSIELFTKAILLDINEFLVFNTEIEKDNVLCQLLRKQYDSKKGKANISYHAVFSVNSYKTIEYGNSIQILHKIFNDKLTKNHYRTLLDLSEYRNTLTHLGFASTFEWYKILVVINKSLELVLDFYAENLIRSDDYFTDDITTYIRNNLSISKYHLHDVWVASWEHVLGDIDHQIELFFMNDLVKVNNVTEDIEYGFHQEINFTYKAYSSETMVWTFKYSYLNEAIIIIDASGLIVGCISIEDKHIVYSHDEEGMPKHLSKCYIFVPKENLRFKIEKIYDISDDKKYERLVLKPDVFPSLIKYYTKNLNNK